VVAFVIAAMIAQELAGAWTGTRARIAASSPTPAATACDCWSAAR